MRKPYTLTISHLSVPDRCQLCQRRTAKHLKRCGRFPGLEINLDETKPEAIHDYIAGLKTVKRTLRIYLERVRNVKDEDSPKNKYLKILLIFVNYLFIEVVKLVLGINS